MAANAARVQTKGAPNSKDRFGYLVVHGVGNQHRRIGSGRSVLHHMGRGIVDPIAKAYGASSVVWTETPERRGSSAEWPLGTPAHAAVDITCPEQRAGRVLIAEAVWADRFRRPPWYLRWLLTLGYALVSLPAVLLLVGPDRRDHSFWEPTETSIKRTCLSSLRAGLRPGAFLISPDFRHMARMGWRFLTLVVLLAAFAALLMEHPWWTVGGATVLVALSCTRLNVADHVIMAAARDQEREELLDFLEERLRWMRAHCDKIVIVAHSQGGFLAHQLMARHGGRNQSKVVRMVGVGSGLKPIWLLQQIRRPFTWAVAWMLPIASLCLGWGTSPLIEPSNSEVAAGMLMQLEAITPSLALPLAAQSPEFSTAMLNGMADSMERIQSGLLLVGDMTWERWAAIAVSATLTLMCGLIIRFRIHPEAKSLLALPVPKSRERLKWEEYSSQHDMVGRMLLPTLPKDVEQEATPVLGHPLGDHTKYFDSEGLLARHLASALLSDVKSSGAHRWAETVARYERALRKQHDRRRCFQGVLMLWVAAGALTLRMAHGASMVEAITKSWQPLAVATLVFSAVFTWRGRRSHRELVAKLDAELRGEPLPTPPVRITIPKHRFAATLALAIGAVFAFFGALGLAMLSRVEPTWRVASPGAPMLAAFVLAVLAAAAGSGYRVRRRWAAGAAFLASLPALTSSGPLGSSLPVWATAPGGPLAGVVVAAVAIALIGLTRARVVHLPEAASSPSPLVPGQRGIATNAAGRSARSRIDLSARQRRQP
ncbi:esterase/lipase family protein [Streptomyces venezuelae]|uniref:esterase/lipase family protein n=1 Tax=Streptomyces venezuelae TaxID=54571 RepID=UPI00379211CE